jgi:hypothetical protein
MPTPQKLTQVISGEMGKMPIHQFGANSEVAANVFPFCPLL